MKIKLNYLLILTLFVVNSLFAGGNVYSASIDLQQKHSVTIVVKDGFEPLVGASVYVKGTTKGGLADVNGIVKLDDLSPEDVLVVSFIGYIPEEITVGNQTSINVSLAMNTEEMEEIVVVGYGSQKKESLTSAITSVSVDDVTATKQPDLVTSLQGKVTGLLIRQGGGTPGKFYSNISLRGYGTPIVVIDGIVRTETYSNARGYGVSTDLGLAQLNPNDIESISVLKDASASIYGMGWSNSHNY